MQENLLIGVRAGDPVKKTVEILSYIPNYAEQMSQSVPRMQCLETLSIAPG